MNKKIIHITLGKINPERPNGVNKVVNSIITYQIENGFDVEFWGISFSNTHNYPIRNYKTVLFQDFKNKFKLDPFLKKELRKLNKDEVIVHLHGVFLPQLFRVARILRKNNIPYFFTPHGGYNLKALEKSKLLKKIYIQLFESSLVNNAKGIQLLGASEKEGFQRFFKGHLHLIPNGQEPREEEPVNSTGEFLKIGFIGRIDIETKGLDLLLESIKLKEEVVLEIIGEGGELKRLKKMVSEMGILHKVVFLGALFGTAKFEAMRNWDALCLVSRNEGLPGVVLEAASIGVPAIVSEQTNMKRYVEAYKAGWVLPNYSAKNLVEQLVKVKEAKRLETISTYQKGAKKMIAKAFDWNKIVHQLAKVYEG